MKKDLHDRLAVVTGGASGIGAACCRVLAERGAKIVVVNIAATAATQVAKEVGGHDVILDVSSADAITVAAERIEKDYGPVDILVTSAEIIQRPLPPEELPLANLDAVIAVDQRGVYLCCVAFGLRMADRGRGSIVNIASVAGMRSMPLHAYAPAKAAVIAMTECLATEWGRRGVRVNSVSPGYTLTPALKDAIERGERDVTLLEHNAAMGRMVYPEEIARAVAFLVSDEASAISEINLPVDCGWLVAPSWHTYGGQRPKGN